LKKVLFFLPSISGGGAERVSIQFINFLLSAGYEVHIATFSADSNEHWLINNNNAKMILLNKARLSRNLFSIIKTIHKLKPNYVYSTFAHINFYLCLIKPILFFYQFKLIIREANMPFANIASSKYKMLYKFGYKYLYLFSNSLIVTSHVMRDEFKGINKCLLGKISIIRNPIDVSRIQQSSFSEERLFSEEYINLISVGRLTYQKGYDILINWFKDQDLSKFHLSILGEGPDANSLMTLVKNLGLEKSVTFLGFQENPYPWVAQADCLLLFSRWEGLPNVVLESLALNTPVLSSSTAGGIGEILELCNHPKIRIFDNVKKVDKKLRFLIEENKDFDQNLLPLEYSDSLIKKEFLKIFNSI